MVKFPIYTICWSGGKLLTCTDGSWLYDGGKREAVKITEQTVLSDFKRRISDKFCLNQESVDLKYLPPGNSQKFNFLPGSKKPLIPISCDDDFCGMINQSDCEYSGSIEVFVSGEAASPQNMPLSSEMDTSWDAVSEVAPEELVDSDVYVEPSSSDGPLPNSSSSPPYVMQEEKSSIFVGHVFNSFSDLLEAANIYATKYGNGIKYHRDGGGISVKCRMQDCPWCLHACVLSTTEHVSITVTDIDYQHTCEAVDIRAGCKLTSDLTGGDTNHNHSALVNHLQTQYGLTIANEQSRETAEEEYRQLSSYCKRIKAVNRGSIVKLTKDKSIYGDLFVSFSASRYGFIEGCRPLIFLDSYPLNLNYHDVLLTATAADANDVAFPLAFAIVNGETKDSWHWFLVELKAALARSRAPKIIFVADYRKGIREALNQVYEGSFYHAYCLRYLTDELNTDLELQLSNEVRHLVVNQFHAAAYALTFCSFKECITNIKGMSQEAYEWVLKSVPEQWANSFFEGERYNHMAANFGQSYYCWAAEVNGLSITQVVDALIDIIVEEHNAGNRRFDASDIGLTSAAETKLQKELLKADSLRAEIDCGEWGRYKYYVAGSNQWKEVVKPQNKTCTCMMWQLTGIPCSHAIAVFEDMFDCMYAYCSKYFDVSKYRITYSKPIRRVPDEYRPLANKSHQSSTSVLPTSTSKRRAGCDDTNPADSSGLKKSCLFSNLATRNECFT